LESNNDINTIISDKFENKRNSDKKKVESSGRKINSSERFKTLIDQNN
jgi:hypothetical protein